LPIQIPTSKCRVRKEIITGYENNVNQMNIVCWKNTELLNNSVSGIYTYHLPLDFRWLIVSAR